MFLYNEVQKREANQERVRVGLIGAGKFGSMFLSQAPFTIGLEVSSIVDISVENARKNCRDVGWTEEQIESVLFFDNTLFTISIPFLTNSNASWDVSLIFSQFSTLSKDIF